MKIFLLLFLLPGLSYAMPTIIIDGTIVWQPVTTYTDDTPITEAITYPVYCNDGSRAFEQTDLVSEQTGTTKPLTDFADGTYVCAVTAKTIVGESVFSNAVNFTCVDQCLSGKGPTPPIIDIQ